MGALRRFDESALVQRLGYFLDLHQNRHKFVLEHDSGVSKEVSLDHVVATTLRPEHNGADGLPQSTEFFVIEGEVDHKQINSTNVAGLGPSQSSRLIA